MVSKKVLKAIEHDIEKAIDKVSRAAYAKGFEDGVSEGIASFKKALADEGWLPPQESE